MEKSFQFDVVTPYGPVVSAKIEEAYIPGAEGDFDVLPGHAAMLAAIRIGELHYRADGQTRYVAISRGFAEITPETATLLVDSAEPAEDIDLERARNARARAEERLKTLSAADPEYPPAAEELERARLRIRVAEKAPRQ